MLTFSTVILILIGLWIFRGTLKKATTAMPEAADNLLQTACVASAALNQQVTTLAAEARVEQRARLLQAAEAYKAIGSEDVTDEAILQSMGLLSKK